MEREAERKVFPTRTPPAGRLVANFADIENVLDDFGFETMDTAEWLIVRPDRAVPDDGAGCSLPCMGPV